MTGDCKVGAVLFHSDEMMTLGSGGVFSLHYPDHPPYLYAWPLPKCQLFVSRPSH